MKEPRFTVFVRDAVPPDEELKTIPGQWRCGDWPAGGIRDREYHMKEQNTWKVNDRDPAHAVYEAVTNYTISPSGREIELEVHFRMASDEKFFHLTETRTLLENDKVVREKKWSRSIPRGNH
ncbi:MAG: hypothetical protein AB2L14_16635 [Candidatus Xenobiia bacterium LiM19]